MLIPTSSCAVSSMTAGSSSSISQETIFPTASAIGQLSWSRWNWITRARSNFRPKLRSEVEAERWTQHDKMLQTEQREQGIIDLGPGEGATYLVRENRGLMIGRVKHLERNGLANEVEPRRWGVSDRAEGSLTELSERNDVIKTVIRRALAGGQMCG
jgi:Protein of unknown function (DUF3363)